MKSLVANESGTDFSLLLSPTEKQPHLFCHIQCESTATYFGLTGTAQRWLCEALLMAAMLFLLSTQLWVGLMDLLLTTRKMLPMLCFIKTIVNGWKPIVYIIIFDPFGDSLWSYIERTGCTGWTTSWTRLVTLIFKDLTDRHLPILVRSPSPTPLPYMQVSFMMTGFFFFLLLFILVADQFKV